MILAVASDYLGHRFVFTLIPALISLTGFAILFAVHNNVHLQYAALFLAAAGTYASMPVIVCWFSANCECLSVLTLYHRRSRTNASWEVGGHRRRAVGTGWQIGFGNSESLTTLRICRTADCACSRRHHCSIFLPRQRRAQLPNRLQHLPRLRLPLDSLLLRVLDTCQLLESSTRSGRGARR